MTRDAGGSESDRADAAGDRAAANSAGAGAGAIAAGTPVPEEVARTQSRRGASAGADVSVIAAIVAVTAAMVVALRLAGRAWVSESGLISIWTSQAWGSETSQQLLDPYSVTHALHGFVFFWVLVALRDKIPPRWQIVAALVVEAVWEVAENSPIVIDRYRVATAALGYTGDTILNSFGDLVSCALGFVFARWLRVRASIVVFALAEIALLFMIRDSLLLSVVMLAFPIEAIKQWQMNL